MNYSLNYFLKIIFHRLCKDRVNAVNALHFSALLIDDFTKHS
jgi:hypothetical protein